MKNVGNLAELSNCASSVHTHPVNAYQRFVNAFVYLKYQLQQARCCQEGTRVWKVESDEKDSILREAFRKLGMTTKRQNYVVF